MKNRPPDDDPFCFVYFMFPCRCHFPPSIMCPALFNFFIERTLCIFLPSCCHRLDFDIIISLLCDTSLNQSINISYISPCSRRLLLCSFYNITTICVTVKMLLRGKGIFVSKSHREEEKHHQNKTTPIIQYSYDMCSVLQSLVYTFMVDFKDFSTV